jgi:uncharacterized protein (DUF433 family)
VIRLCRGLLRKSSRAGGVTGIQRDLFVRERFDATTLTVYRLGVDYSKIITVEPGKRSGKPCIRGLRITVYDVLDYLASGMTHEQILSDFPYLTEEDIQACLAFAADRERRTSFVAGEAPVR